MKGFLAFIREQGVVGLAIGFILGGAVSKLVTAFITDIIDPILAVAFGAASGLATATLTIGPVHFLYGDLLSVAIDFVVVATVVYAGVEIIGINKLDKKKD